MTAAAAASEALENAARHAYASLVGFLASRAGGDLAAAEDALGEAFLAALRQWPQQGLPAKPEAWLLTVARRRLLDSQRRTAVRDSSGERLHTALHEAEALAEMDGDFPDERLKLLFVCAHPAIDPAARAPLMLQTVLGLDASAVAASFLVAPSAMSQRLVRAKTKIKAAAIPFLIPDRATWPERTGFVLDAVYAAFDQAWQAWPSNRSLRFIALEALRLGQVLVDLLPEEPEAAGLLAMMLYCHSRRAARLDETGRYIPLDEQDPAAWDHAMIDRAEQLLQSATLAQRPGRFQIEAAIQSAHAHRRKTGRVEWRAIAALYELLVRTTPALGAHLGQAIAVARAESPARGLALLDELPAERLLDHQPYWAARAALLSQAQRRGEAAAAFQKAIGLCADPAMREYLRQKAVACSDPAERLYVRNLDAGTPAKL